MVFLSIVLPHVCKRDLGFVRAGKYGLCKCIANVSCRYSNQIWLNHDRSECECHMNWVNNFCNAPMLGTCFAFVLGG